VVFFCALVDLLVDEMADLLTYAESGRSAVTSFAYSVFVFNFGFLVFVFFFEEF
jgi:hypothetical protein